MKYLFLLAALLCFAHTNCQTLDDVESTPIVLTADSEGDTYMVLNGSLVKTYAGKPVVEDIALKTDPNNAVFLVGYLGGVTAKADSDVRNGLNAGLEAHVVLKSEPRFGVDFGLGFGYASLSQPGGKYSDVAAHASVGFTDCKYVSGGVRFSYAATEGVVSPAAYLALTYPLSNRLNLFGRGTIGVDVIPESKVNYTAGRAQIGVSYSLMR